MRTSVSVSDIPDALAGKADLDPATGFVESSQIAPLQGRQTGVKTGNGGFVSTDPALCLSTAKTLVVTFKCEGTPNSFLYFDHGGSNANLGVSIFIASNRLFCNIGPKTLVSFNPESGKLYQVVISFDKNGTSAGYMNSVKDRETTDYSTITDPTHFCLGALSDGSGSFSGVILGARLFNYALTASEVATLWNGGEPERYMLPLSGEMRTGLVAEYIAAGLLADKWRDTSGAGLDLPYVPTATGGTAVLVYDQPSGDSDTFAVLAASDCSLEARVTTLERTLAAVLSGAAVIPALQVRELGVWGSNNLILTGSGAPAKAPDRAGQLYIDTASGAVYKSTGNAAVSDWKNL
ncbi:MAG TPA: LamG domain-containing protein [Alistipes communis]|nr:LamG domain-containing protein [Alistipes communis]